MSVPRRHGIATVSLSGLLEDKIDAAAAAGFDAIELFENDLIASASSPEAVRDQVRDRGLRIELFQPFRDAEGLGDDAFALARRRFGRKLDLMQRLDVSTILVCSSVADTARCDILASDEVSAAQLRMLADDAAERGCRIAFEALAWGTEISTWAHAWEVVRQADHPALGLCLDSFHVLARGSSLDGIEQVPSDKLMFVQLADAPQLSMGLLPWSRHHRLFPGQGTFDLAGFVRALDEAGYDGPWSIEVFNDVYRQSDPRSTAVDARRSLLALESEADLVGRAGDDVGVSGIAFVELSVDRTAETALVDLLDRMGFRHTGQHRTKPVQLWEHGDAAIVLNSAIDVHDAETGTPAVRALGLSCARPEIGVQRARRLLADPVLTRRADDESPLWSVLAPDDVAMILCPQRHTAGTDWRDDFFDSERHSRPQRTDPGAGVLGFDHVMLSQPFDRVDEAELFHRSLFDWSPVASAEISAPFGLVRARALRRSDHGVALLLTAAVLRRGQWRPAVPHPQGIAFAVDDLAATVAALRRAGVDLVRPSQNYHDDVDARLLLSPQRREQLRRDDAFCEVVDDDVMTYVVTPIVGDRLYFVFVQRSGGGAVYGLRDAPVWMAAQRRRRSGSSP